MKELVGRAAVLHQTLALVAIMSDCAFVSQHICPVQCSEGGEKIAVRWIMGGRHLGYGSLGAPTGHRLFLMGISHFPIVAGRIIREWVVYDEMAVLTQIKLAERGAAAG